MTGTMAQPLTDAASGRVAPTGRRRYAARAFPGRRRSWNEEAVIAALRSWSAEQGAPPRREDWSGARPAAAGPAQRKWMREHPRWPSASCVAAHVGSWGAALHAAGLTSRPSLPASAASERAAAARRLAARGHSAGEIAALVGVSRATLYTYRRAAACPHCGRPMVRPDAGRCGACAGREPTVRREWVRAEIRAALRAWGSRHGAPPTYREWTPQRGCPGRWEADSPRWPSAAVVCAVYAAHDDPWNAALRDAGLDSRHRRWSDDAIRAALGAFWARTGRLPRAAELRDSGWSGPCAGTLRRRYGSVARAWRMLAPVPKGPFRSYRSA